MRQRYYNMLQCTYGFCAFVSAGKMGAGFGIGALEDLGDEDEDVYDQGHNILINSSSLFFSFQYDCSKFIHSK
jgi:hypothetical protein